MTEASSDHTTEGSAQTAAAAALVLGERDGVHLKRRILLPLAVTLTLLVLAFAASLYRNERLQLAEGTAREITAMQSYYRGAIEARGDKLRAALDFLGRDPALRRALAAGNRQQLLAHAEPVLARLKSDLNVTHFYFLGADRKVIARVHQPERFGDIIDRRTALQAESTGRLALGAELGPLGTFTLRAVAPVHEGSRLIGYVELGEEILDATRDLAKIFGSDGYVVLHKQHLARAEWEHGMRMLGRVHEWDRFADTVLAAQTRPDVPPELARMFSEGRHPRLSAETELAYEHRLYRASFIPLLDTAGSEVGDVVTLRDVTAVQGQTRQTLTALAGVSVVLGALLLTLSYVVLERVRRSLRTSRKLMIEKATAHDALQRRHIAELQASIAERKRAEEQIHNLAFYDPLTGLPNRRLLLDRLAQAVVASANSGRYGALLIIDLDHFKTLNDTRGHAIGNRLLTEVAQRLRGCIQPGDVVARLGGDEFGVVLDRIDADPQLAAARADAIAVRILNAFNAPYRLEDIAAGDCHITPSIGISLFHSRADTVDELLRRSELAMYEAKDAGRNTLRFFDPATQAAIEVRVGLQNDLRRALPDGQLLLHYQAQVDSAGRIFGAESLLRWQHPARGLVMPGDFIALAEESGLIVPIGEWVLEVACRQIAAWAAAPHTEGLQLAVNVSARQFRQETFTERLQALLARTGANPRRLKLELTESVVLDNVEDTIAKMHALKALGIGFSMDDFGVGYSSLSYLKRLPLDQLKIDRSFVGDIATDADDAAIVQAIIGLGQTLRLMVIAEGVEDEAQRDFLTRHGCPAFQGYLFSRPLPLADFERLLARQHAGPALLAQ